MPRQMIGTMLRANFPQVHFDPKQHQYRLCPGQQPGNESGSGTLFLINQYGRFCCPGAVNELVKLADERPTSESLERVWLISTVVSRVHT